MLKPNRFSVFKCQFFPLPQGSVFPPSTSLFLKSTMEGVFRKGLRRVSSESYMFILSWAVEHNKNLF